MLPLQLTQIGQWHWFLNGKIKSFLQILDIKPMVTQAESARTTEWSAKHHLTHITFKTKLF